MSGKFLRIVGVVLLGLTVAFHLLGAVGSSCVALGAEKYASMAALAPFKWFYQLLALVTLAAALYGFGATVALARGKAGSYRRAVLVLVFTLAAALVQMLASRALRGASQPNDMRVYVTLITLAVFLVFRIPRIWARIEMEGRGGAGLGAAGAAFMLSGALALSVHLWAAPTHTLGGVNYADAFRVPMLISGWGLALAGLFLTARAEWLRRATPTAPQPLGATLIPGASGQG